MNLREAKATIKELKPLKSVLFGLMLNDAVSKKSTKEGEAAKGLLDKYDKALMTIANDVVKEYEKELKKERRGKVKSGKSPRSK